MKRGKTFAMMDIASYAMQTGCKVWFISLEMTKNQVVRRLWQQWSGSIATQEEDIVEPRFEDGNIILEEKHVHQLSPRNMMRIRNKLQTNMRTSGFKVFSYPKNTFKVSDLRILIENSVSYNNELPDFITIDYASIMQPEMNKDKRFELDQIWADLSALAEEYNIHILTASQTNKAGFTRDIQQGDSAEANSITAHVAKMFALNQNPTNKRQHVMRYAMMFNRHSDFDTDKQVVVLQNLACGKSMIDSMWMENVKNLWKEDKKKESDEDGRNFG
jgi:replicative DNA helicase